MVSARLRSLLPGGEVHDDVEIIRSAPVSLANVFSISDGAALMQVSRHIHTTDPDNTVAQLTDTASGNRDGGVELVAAPGRKYRFQTARINSGAVQFVQDGCETEPSYALIGSKADRPFRADILLLPPVEHGQPFFGVLPDVRLT